jgi:ribosomal-protein-alanine N-acetyltransferase
MAAIVDKKRKAEIIVRPIIRRDFKEVLTIEAEIFQFPWLAGDFEKVLRGVHCYGAVAEYQDTVVGFVVFELLKHHIRVLNLAVEGWHRRCGVGRMMIEKLVGRLSVLRRRAITCEIRESNLDAQLFFCAVGFRAVAVLRDFYENTPEDAYLFTRFYKPWNDKPNAL